MTTAQFEYLLKQVIGMDTASVGSSVIQRAVQLRLAACDLKDEQAYLERLQTSGTELQEFVEAVVVPETWFFRDREAFAAMVRMVREEWQPANPERTLRLLSLPCATGEEPYSMAMALLDAGFPADRFRVDAVDISARALEQARQAVYGKNSFRGNDLDFRDRYFQARPEGHHLADAVRRQVHFEHGNLFDAAFLSGAEVYDVIYCRNLLIYFDTPTQDRTLEVLARLLRAKGFLFLGPSEAALQIKDRFTSAKAPGAFAFRKAESVPAKQRRAESQPAQPAPRQTRISNRPASAPAPSGRSRSFAAAHRDATSGKPVSVIEPPQPHLLELDEIQRLADNGRLAEAEQCCENHLNTGSPSPRAYYLLGLVRDATGNAPGAIEAYRKVLYLDPNHYETLIHLALLLEAQGDDRGARVLNDRAHRLAKRSKP